MQNNTAIPFPPSQFTAEAPLTEVLRQGAQRLLAQAIEVEVAMFLARYADRRDIEGWQAIVQNGYLPERNVQTGIGTVRVHGPRGRDRSEAGLRFHSALLPPYLRRSNSLEALLPWLYRKGVSTGDFSEA
jgi:putative transposase